MKNPIAGLCEPALGFEIHPVRCVLFIWHLTTIYQIFKYYDPKQKRTQTHMHWHFKPWSGLFCKSSVSTSEILAAECHYNALARQHRFTQTQQAQLGEDLDSWYTILLSEFLADVDAIR
jgi:hypothetical protein